MFAAQHRQTVRSRGRSVDSASDSLSHSQHSWSVDRLSVDGRSADLEMACSFFPQCEDCFFVPERDPWTEDFSINFVEEGNESPKQVRHGTMSLKQARTSYASMSVSGMSSSMGSSTSNPLSTSTSSAQTTGVPHTVESLSKMMRRPDTGVPLGSRYHRFRRFKDAFFGSDAVAWIMKQCGLTRNEAVMVAQELLRRQVFINVVDQSTLFHDSKNAIYSFLSGPPPTALNTSGISGSFLSLNQSSGGAPTNVIFTSPREIANCVRTLLPALSKLRARTFENVGFLGRTYNNCFLGTDVLDLILNEVQLRNRSDVRLVAEKLLRDGFIRPVLPSVTSEPLFEEHGLFKLNAK